MTKKPPAKTRSGKGDKFQSLTGGEVHGRGGESLPSHERALVGREQDWQRDEKKSGAARSAKERKKNSEIEIEYERGPGSRFQIEGRGGASRRKHSK